jgi:pilus assembly protein CpaB
MSLRNVLLAVGAVFVLAGVVLLIAWFGQLRNTPAVVATPVEIRQAVLVAARAIPAGKSLEPEDITSKDIGPGEALHPGNIQRGQETEFLGMSSRREVAEGQPLIASDFVHPRDQQQSLAAALKPGYRAISISVVDSVQSVAGLASPGDYVDVILTQSFADSVTTYPGRKTVGETVLRNVRVIAINQSLNPQPNIPAVTSAVCAEGCIPKTVTLELVERDAEVLLVAAQLAAQPGGKFQLVVRSREAGTARPEDKRNADPVWASDVSQALAEIAPPQPKQVSVRIYSGQPKSDGYLCSIVACTPSDVNTVVPQIQNQTQVIPRRY